ncbi:hypothetical protein B0H14DRAFT_2781690, partial [Mycena olivaceomarginata]
RSAPFATGSCPVLSKSTYTAPIPKKVALVFLSQEQTHVLKLAQEGRSLFYTGSAGTGKSALKKKHIKTNDAVAITASTGIAACNIGGFTIHSFAGPKVLIIDEVSMLDRDLILRKSIQLFGGIQLPPLSPKAARASSWPFEAELWKQAISKTFKLTKSVSFCSLSREFIYNDGLGPTETVCFLFISHSRREDVDRSNHGRINPLTSEAHTFQAVDGGAIQDPNQRDKLLGNFMAVPQLVLCQDAQVSHADQEPGRTLVNGSMGRVLRFCDQAMYGTDRDVEGSEGQKPASAAPRFSLPNGGKRTLLITPDTFKVELPTGEVQASRNQLLLILAGDEHPQVAGADAGTRQGRSREGFREGCVSLPSPSRLVVFAFCVLIKWIDRRPSVRRPLARDIPRGAAGA